MIWITPGKAIDGVDLHLHLELGLCSQGRLSVRRNSFHHGASAAGDLEDVDSG